VKNPDFIHLRTRSTYSLLEGSLHFKQILDLCHEYGIPAIGLTDSNNLFGALEFSEYMANSGIQPIVGTTINLSFNYDVVGNKSDATTDLSKVCLLAKNNNGYKNLMKISSHSYNSNNSTVPFINIDYLVKNNEDLIILTGGIEGFIGKDLLANKRDDAFEKLKLIKNTFNDRVYIEIQRHLAVGESSIEDQQLNFAYDIDIPIVATNNIFFKTKDDFESNDILKCIAESDYVANENRHRLTSENYFKSPLDMRKLFSDLPEAIDNTIEIATRCIERPMTRDPILPKFNNKTIKNENDKEFDNESDSLIELAKIGLSNKIKQFGVSGNHSISDYEERLTNELKIIIDMDYPGYFLIVSEIITWAKNNKIPVGPGRGSGAGSLVAWSLNITDLDPIKFGLVFERFLNPYRVSMPDFDIDFCPVRRDEVINHIRDHYGHDKVAQIITFGKLQARAVLRDVGRVLQMPYNQVDRLCKLVPSNPANPMTLADAIEQEKRFQIAREEDETVDRLLKISVSLEGLNRHASTHAAGVVIGDRPLVELVPLYRDPRTEIPLTQFSMKWAEQAGLVKFDILGLKTLTLISECVKQLASIDINIDIQLIPLDDVRTLKLFKSGETSGVFQFESPGMKDLLIKAQPENFDDLIALVALFRPGPMENIPKYLASKHGKEEPEKLHELIEPIIADTYGVIIYQEQVIQIAQKLSGFSAGEADLLRRAMGKKIKSEMDAQRGKFITGAEENGVNRKKSEYIFDLVDKFAGYGFNKAHSAAYALIAYQTAFLKANYPLAFMSALLTLDIGNTDKLSNFISEAKRMNIKILPPSINSSNIDFRIEGKAIRFSLAALKNVGNQCVDYICNERHENGIFKSVTDFISRIDPHFVNKRSFESLICAGAFDVIETNRAKLFKYIELLLSEAHRLFNKKQDGQTDIFGSLGDTPENQFTLVETKNWDDITRLNNEFNSIGTYISGHPLDSYSAYFKKQRVLFWVDFKENVLTKSHKEARLAGIITNRMDRRGKTGRNYSFIRFSDSSDEYETVVFSDILNKYNDILVVGNSVIVKVDAELESERIRLKINDVQIIDSALCKNLNEGDISNDTQLKSNIPKINQSKEVEKKVFRIVLKEDVSIEEVVSKLVGDGGNSIVYIAFYDKTLKKQIELKLGDYFLFNQEIQTDIISIPGIVSVDSVS
jgi:DNA polymerase III subunit alpha